MVARFSTRNPNNIDPSEHSELVLTALARIKEPFDEQIRDDLLQAGHIGLRKAAKKFDPSLGCAFSSYAIPKIIGEICRYLKNKTRNPNGIDPTEHFGLIWAALDQVPEPFNEQIRSDLLQEGYIGLHKAAKNFDPSLGYAFSSYAIPKIIGEMRHYIRDKIYSVRLPRHIDKDDRARFWVDSLDRRCYVSTDQSGCPLGELILDPRTVPDEQLITIKEAIRSISPECRDALNLTIAGGDMMHIDAAKQLGCAPVTVTRRIKKGINELKKLCA